MQSYLTHLECTVCNRQYAYEQPIRTCTTCDKVLYPRYDLQRLRKDMDREQLLDRSPDLWRFFELLPLQDSVNMVTLGEGGTPLLKATDLSSKLGIENLFIKEEGGNPTGSFKARGMAVAVSRAKELGLKRLCVPSAGNAAGALAAYAARAGLEAHVFMPEDAPAANREECVALGANLTLVQGHIGDAGKLSLKRSQELNLFDLSTLKEPYRVEGKKTMGLEIAMDLGWRLPNVIIYPTGGGTGILGMYKAFQELQELGWVTDPQPRFVVVQAEGCHPIVEAFNKGWDASKAWDDPQTIAHGLRVPHPFADYLILEILRNTGGAALTVTDQEMIQATGEMAAAEGIFPSPEGAATLIALKRQLKSGDVSPEESVVLLDTGSGLKYLDMSQ